MYEYPGMQDHKVSELQELISFSEGVHVLFLE